MVSTSGFGGCRHDRHQPPYGHSSGQPPQQWRHGTWPIRRYYNCQLSMINEYATSCPELLINKTKQWKNLFKSHSLGAVRGHAQPYEPLTPLTRTLSAKIWMIKQKIYHKTDWRVHRQVNRHLQQVVLPEGLLISGRLQQSCQLRRHFIKCRFGLHRLNKHSKDRQKGKLLISGHRKDKLMKGTKTVKRV